MIMKVFFKRCGNVTNHSNGNRIRISFKNRLFTNYIQIFCMKIVILASVVRAAPYAVNNNATFLTLNHAIWPPMQHHDIWNDSSRYFEESPQDNGDFNTIEGENDILKQQEYSEIRNDSTQDIYDNFVATDIDNDTLTSKRQGKGTYFNGRILV